MVAVHIDAQIPWQIGRADDEHWVGTCNPLRLDGGLRDVRGVGSVLA